MTPRTRQALRTFWIMVVLFFCAWIPRVVALDAFVTVDERKWLARSANFLYALAHGDFANTFQREHPGVTVMWAGALGILQKFPDYLAAGTWLLHVGQPADRGVAQDQHHTHAA